MNKGKTRLDRVFPKRVTTENMESVKRVAESNVKMSLTGNVQGFQGMGIL